MMWLMFQMVFTLGAIPMNWIDALFSAVINGERTFGTSLLSLLVFDGLVAESVATVIFLPNIILLFLGFRLWKKVDTSHDQLFVEWLFRRMGLSGKSFCTTAHGFWMQCSIGHGGIDAWKQKKKKLPWQWCRSSWVVARTTSGIYFAHRCIFATSMAGNNAVLYLSFGIFVAFGTGEIIGKWYPEKSLPLLLQLPKYHRPSLKKICSFRGDRAFIFLNEFEIYCSGEHSLMDALFISNFCIETGGVEASYGARMAKTIQPILRHSDLTGR